MYLFYLAPKKRQILEDSDDEKVYDSSDASDRGQDIETNFLRREQHDPSDDENPPANQIHNWSHPDLDRLFGNDDQTIAIWVQPSLEDLQRSSDDETVTQASTSHTVTLVIFILN